MGKKDTINILIKLENLSTLLELLKQRIKKKNTVARGNSVLSSSVIAAVGIGHKLGEPSLDDRQLNEATSIAAEAVSDNNGGI